VTDGTAVGTALVRDINLNTVGSYPAGYIALGNGTALFSANDGAYGNELWVTDGTAAGTALLADINPGSGSSVPQHITALPDAVLRR
jgi:ELWxxDGT repeat protein